jgi:hypothetical protein
VSGARRAEPPAIAQRLLPELTSHPLLPHPPCRPRRTRKSVERQYKDLSKPSLYEECVWKALYLANNLPVDWSVEDCHKNMGVGRSKFYEFKKLNDAGALTSEDINTKMGRKEYLTEDGKQELHDEVQRRSLQLKGVKFHSEFYPLVVSQIQAGAVNQLAEVNPGKTYITGLIKELFKIVPRADIKNDARLKAFENIRNPLALCAMLEGYNRRGTDLEGMWTSFDDVTVQLNGWEEKPKVVTTKNAVALLAAQHLGVSTGGNKDKRRVIVFNALLAGTGECLSRIAKITDTKFTECKKKPKFFAFGNGESELHVVMAHPQLDDEVLYEALLRKIIVPAAEKHRLSMIAAEEEGLRELISSQSTQGPGSQSGPSGASAAGPSASQTSAASSTASAPLLSELLGNAEEEEDEEQEQEQKQGQDQQQPRGEQWREVLHPSYYNLKNPVTCSGSASGSAGKAFARVVIASDGAHAQLEASLTQIAARIEKYDKPVDLTKYCGGCSMSESLNDIGAMHRILHTTFKSPSYRYTSDYQDIHGKAVRELKAWLSSRLEAASFRTFWKCLMHAQDFLAKSFQPSLVKAAYKTAGIFPVNYKRVLSVNPYFRTLPTVDAQAVIDHIPELGMIFNKWDMVPEVDFDTLMQKEDGERLDNVPTKTWGMPLNDMVACRQRAGRVNGPEFMKKYGVKAVENASKREVKKKKVAATTAVTLTAAVAEASAYSASLGTSTPFSAAVVPVTAATTTAPTTTATTTTTTTTATTTTASTSAIATTGGKKRKKQTHFADGTVPGADAEIEGGADQPAAKKPKKPKPKRCQNKSCNIEMQPQDVFACAKSKGIRAASSATWTKCGRIRCPVVFCETCTPLCLQGHRDVCEKPAKEPKENVGM